MLRRLKEFEGRALSAREGDIGHVQDFYYDDQRWHIRYLVVDTQAGWTHQRVLIAPEAVGPLNGPWGTLPTALTHEQIRSSPSIDTNRPVSRQREEELRRHYNWAPYWGPIFGEGGLAAPIAVPVAPEDIKREESAEKPGDPHLRSVKDTRGYSIEARDGALGHVEDFLVDDAEWDIRYVLVATRHLWPGKKVVIAPSTIAKVSWRTQSVTVNLTRDDIRNAPEHEPASAWSSPGAGPGA